MEKKEKPARGLGKYFNNYTIEGRANVSMGLF